MKVGSRVPNYSALYVLWALKVFENAVYSLLMTCQRTVLLLVALITAIASLGSTVANLIAA